MPKGKGTILSFQRADHWASESSHALGNTSQPCFLRSCSAMHVKLSTTFPVAVLHVSVALLLTLFSVEVCLGHAAETFSPARVAVYFSPSGGATDAVVREVNAATQQILVQAYSFTSAPIAKALVDAHKRGVKVLAVLDTSNETEKYSAATF